MNARRRSNPVLQTLWVVCLSLGLAVVLFHFVFQPFQVSGLSMSPTLRDRDYLLVDRVFFRTWGVRRGDLVVFKLPSDPRYIVKRVEALPGQRVEIREGRLQVDGRTVGSWSAPPGDDRTFGPETLGPDEYLCLGDNPALSLDSRTFGPVRRSEIYGRVLLRYLPLSQSGFIGEPRRAP